MMNHSALCTTIITTIIVTTITIIITITIMNTSQTTRLWLVQTPSFNQQYVSSVAYAAHFLSCSLSPSLHLFSHVTYTHVHTHTHPLVPNKPLQPHPHTGCMHICTAGVALTSQYTYCLLAFSHTGM
mmetsp:Transcript_3125/g.6826  ORF Transcript_3125/g.6826 Transcript_3125/m.6826 type:complete len:127 (+) Transcript_3125:466-846(+)